MKNIVKPSLLIALCAMASHASADDYLGIINLELKATVVSDACVIEARDNGQTVDLGTWATQDLPRTGSTTRAKKFSISLHNCPPSRPVAIRFDGQTASYPDLIKLSNASTASNVAIELKDKHSTRLGLMSDSPTVTPDANGDATLDFSANLIATGTPVGAGTTKADLTFIINYY